MKTKILLIAILLIGSISTVFPQNSFRRAIFLAHSSGSRLYDYDSYTGLDSNVTSVPDEMDIYNIANEYIGADTVGMVIALGQIGIIGYVGLEVFYLMTRKIF